MQIYLVGGAVRDKYLGLPIKDRDWVVVGAQPQALLSLGYQPVGKDFPVFLHPETHEEYALARTEKKTGAGYTGFTCEYSPDISLEADLQRRDLTINAMAESSTGTLIDPFGGQQDLEKKLLKHVSPAFVEDPLRVLRVARLLARYAHLGFQIAPETFTLMKKLCANGELSTVSKERVWQELQRALTETQPWHFFETLYHCNAWPSLLPALDPADYQIFQQPQTLHFFQKACEQFTDSVQRLSAFFLTAVNYPVTSHANLAAQQKTKRLLNQLKAPRIYVEFSSFVAGYHTLYFDLLNWPAEHILAAFKQLHAFHQPQKLDQFIQVCGVVDGLYGSEIFTQMLLACRNVKSEHYLQRGFTGILLGQRIEEAQCAAIQQLLDG